MATAMRYDRDLPSSSGILAICLGIISFHIGKIYDGIKSGPRYVISKEFGSDKDE